MPEGAETSFTLCDAYRYFAVRHSYWCHK